MAANKQIILGFMVGPFITFRKNLIVLGFRLLFTPPLFPVDIHGARPGQNSLPLGDHEEFGDEISSTGGECLLMVQVCLAPGQNAGGTCCNEPPSP
jgi:hypothetical protein